MSTLPHRSDTLPQNRNGHLPKAAHHTEQEGGEPEVFVSPTAVAAPSISLVVPALNEEKLIGRLLDCFPRAELARCNVELIVSDGGSHDNTMDIARAHADLVVRHTANRRQTIAEGRNLGAQHARGDLLCFINADTVPQDPKEFLQTLFQLAEAGQAAAHAVAFACAVHIAPQERTWSDTLFHTFFNNYVRFLNVVGLGMGRGECQVVWRDAFNAIGGYHNHMAAGEDFDLYRRLSSRGKIGERKGLRVFESPRRFRRFGYVRILFEWTLNAVAVMVLGRSISKEWEEIR